DDDKKGPKASGGEKKAAPQTESAAPLNLTRIQPTKEGRKLIKKIAARGEELIKSTPKPGEMNVEKKSLHWLRDAVEEIPGTSLQRIDENGYKYAVVIKRGNGKKEVWYVQNAGSNLNWLKLGSESEEFYLINKADPKMTAVFAQPSGDPEKNAGHILDALNEARRNAQSQENDPA